MKRIIVPIRFAVVATVFVTVLFGFLGCAATDELSYQLSESTTASPEGVFAAELPSASGMGRLIVIHLFENGNAMRTSVYIGELQGDYVEEGTWSADDGVVNVVLKNTAQPPVDVELSFKFDSGGLTSTSYDESPMGKTEVHFTRVAKSF